MPNISGSNVLVIGGAGFIGSHVVEELLLYDVRKVVIFDNFCRGTLDNLKRAVSDPRVSIFPIGGDICRPDVLEAAVKDCDYVVHLAALWLLQCHEFPESAFEVNIRGTFNVLEACRKYNIKRLVYSSSASVYGDAVQLPMTETHPFNNRTFYGATKIAGEAMCRAYYERYKIPYVGLRYMNVYGPRQDYKGAYVAVVMKILDRLDKGLPPIIYGDGSQSYDFVFVKDVATANVKALIADSVDQFYNVGTGVQTSLKEICTTILKLTGSSLHIQYEPGGQTFVTNRVGATAKAKDEIGFIATTKLEDGLRDLIQWRKTHIDQLKGCSDKG